MNTLESLNILNSGQSGIRTIQHQFGLFIQSDQYSIIVFISVLIVFVLVSLFLFRILVRIKISLFEPAVLLEIVPPANTEKTAYTTQQLFSIIHNLSEQQSLWQKLLGKKITFSCEINSTHSDGIHYLLRTHPKYVNNLKRSLFSYLPEVHVAIVNDYIPEVSKNFMVVEFVQTKPFAYSLKKQSMLEEHDPVAYITGMMTKLSLDELVSFQAVLSPSRIKTIPLLKKKILNGDDVLEHIENKGLPFVNWIQGSLSILNWIVSTIVNDFSSSKKPLNYSYINLNKQPRSIGIFEQQAVKLVEEKIDQSLFDVRLRLLVVVRDKVDMQERVKGFFSSLGVYTNPSYQSLKMRPAYTNRILNQFLFFLFKKRLLSLIFNHSPMVLSVSEVSDLYHFPFTNVTQTENIVKVHSKELPAPLALKQASEFDVVFAQNKYGGATTMIGLSEDERKRHMYVIGATGSGKTTMLTSMIDQDIKNNKGVCVIDPHGDLSESLLDSIPESRINDLIYFNPYDISYPIGINLLELTPGLDEDSALLEKEFIAESVISLFRKMFSDGSSGHPHRIEYILRNTIHTAFTVENATLFTIFELLNNPPFQKQVIQKLQDESLKNFWKYEFGMAGDFQKVKMVAPVTSRIGRFLFSPSAKRILEQERSTINFDEILDSRKILICNLSKGNIGEDTSEVMGIMILNKLQLAALKRARKEQSTRTQFYLYVDEFQNFATPSFVQMLSEARKYGLNLIIAEQSTSQQSDKNLTHIVLANVGTVVSFRSANPIDEELLLRQFSPYVDRGEISNLPAYRFYMKISALHPEEPFSGQTMPLNLKPDKDFRKRLVEMSRERHAIIYTSKKTTKNVEEMRTKQKKKEDIQPSQQSVFPEG